MTSPLSRPVTTGIAFSLVLHVTLLTLAVTALPSPEVSRRASAGDALYAARVAAPDGPGESVVHITQTPADVTSELVESELGSVVERVQSTTRAEKLQRLDQMRERLEQQSSGKQLDQLAAHFQRWLGLQARAGRPAADSSPGFDYDTAQLHDVRRSDVDGVAAYTAVLLDAEGRTREVPLTAAEGKSIYEIMQKIRESPLLEAIYRQIAMPLLDQMITNLRAQELSPPASPPQSENRLSVNDEERGAAAGSRPHAAPGSER